MRTGLEAFYKLFEGGNVFKDADKQPLTVRIEKDKIASSLAFVENILGFKLDQWLGSTGKKPSSGDVDVSVDDTKHDKKEVANRLKAWAKSQGLKPSEWVKLSGDSVHFKLPIVGTDEFAQLDLMFGNPEFQAWSMRGEPGEYNGSYRHILLASIAKAQGMKWSYKNGLMDRATDKTISKDPHEIVRKLLPGYTGDPMKLNIDSILKFIYSKYKNEPEKIEALIGEAVATLSQHYGVQLPMPNQTTVHESNDTDEYFVARLRDRIMELDMEPIIERSSNPYKEYIAEAKLRDINHLEDLVLEQGPGGLLRAIKLLAAFAQGKAHSATTIKWDGSPAIVFGRDENGQFILTDKSGWVAKGYDGKAKSAKELQQMFINRAPTMDADRQAFIKNMGNVFNEFEKATPKDFRGFLSGDLMYTSKPPVQNNQYVFEPNVVQYRVDTKSKIGKRIGTSDVGIVVHNYIGNQFKSPAAAAKAMQGNDVFVIPPVHVSRPPMIDKSAVAKLNNIHKAISKSPIFKAENLKGISDFYKLIYTYINQTVDVGIENLSAKNFAQWLQGYSKLTDRKRENLGKFLEAYGDDVKNLFAAIKGVMAIKDELVKQFDAHPSDVQQITAGEPGGEGYVVKDKEGPVKLVRRGGFTAANRAKHR